MYVIYLPFAVNINLNRLKFYESWYHLILSGVNVFSKRTCKQAGLAPQSITKGEFCTGIVDEDQLQPTLCNTDSGGPLICDIKGRVHTCKQKNHISRK